MNARTLLQLVLGVWGTLWALGTAWAEGSATLDAPASVPAGSYIQVEWTGPHRYWDRIGLVKVGAPDSTSAGNYSAPVGPHPLSVLTPEVPGQYELRYFARDPNEILARRTFTVLPVTATLQGPASAAAGSRISVSWTGPDNRNDRIGIVKVGTPDKASSGDFSAPTAGHHPLEVRVPEAPGEYELRYVTGGHHTLAKAPLRVEGNTATVEGPGTAVSGASISVSWTGPNNRWDRIGIVKVGTPDKSASGNFSAYTAGRHPLPLTAPEAPGEYEIRYVTEGHATLAKAPLQITGAEATLKGPGSAAAGSYFQVEWKGPGNYWDRITVAPKGAPEDQWKATSHVGKRPPTRLRAPLEVGDYELRYQTGQTATVLARDALQVTPAQVEPGQIKVTAGQHGLGAAGSAVEVILDASGSMLQRIGSVRRIDIAKQTLKNLTSKLIPAGTPFALRVFGRRANSCETELEIPLRPLDATGVGSQVDALNAESNAKTPIAASLAKVAADLGGVKGERLVILVTDGEETCGGNPASAIEKLRKGGVNVRVNIVGFAVDDRKTAALFRQWSSVGGGGYFDARDAAGLDAAFSLALRPAFEVLDAQQKVVADGLTGGEPVSVLPGKYSVKLKGAAVRPQAVTVRAKQTTHVEF